MAVNSVIINYNDGFLSINHVFDSLGFPAGRYFFFNANEKDDFRLKKYRKKVIRKKFKKGERHSDHKGRVLKI